MEPPPKWYPLPHFPELPALLASTRFGESSYTLHITDLVHVWVEKLDRRGILLRSLQENTSIDLVDADPEQWAVFLSKLRAAFDPASPDHALTSLTIAAATGAHSKNPGGLTLRITCELPHPLSAPQWPVHLTKCEPATLASELVLPLLQERYIQARGAEDLMSQLKERDAIISKLLDKLSSMNVPLELIFNSLSSKHAITRAAAEERIKGLAPFHEEKWRSQQNTETPQDAAGLLHGVFGDPTFGRAANPDLGVSDTLNDWWEKLGSGFHTAIKTETKSPDEESQKKPRESTPSSEHVEEDFQVQTTPPRRFSRSSAAEGSGSGRSGKGKTRRNITDSDESDVPDRHPTGSQNKSRLKIGGPKVNKAPPRDPVASQSSRTLHTDENDTESETEDEEQSEPSKSAKGAAARLGTIGKPKRPSQPIEPAPVGGSTAKDDSETPSGSDSDSGDSAKQKRSLATTSSAPRKGGLGRIGGKAKATTPPPPPAKHTHDSAIDNLASPKKTETRKLGAIGKKPRAEPKRLHSDAPAEPEEEETDEQKAERKRAELAKELSRQTAVPARKKRKF
ncbi:XLF-domain-containing protein [Xylaria arbuscula]|nr:XLF-domain-containing protein [Xylaria arbuscula]